MKMKTKQLIQLLLTILMLALVVPAHAQLNLNKLGKQVKKAARRRWSRLLVKRNLK